MRGPSSEQLSGGACHDLHPAIADKYFQANGHTERFQHVTAKAMCAGCPVQEACLADAIEHPTRAGIRGGESAHAVRALNYQHQRERTPALELARKAIGWQLPLKGAHREPGLRAGHFETVPLAFPELGGEL